MFNSSRKVDAARKVSAVCLIMYQHAPRTKYFPVDVLCNFVGLNGSVCPVKGLQAELFHIRLTSGVVYYCIIC
jgi:hypothetical protein